MNILLTTFGQTWPIVPELIGLTNPGSVKLFENHPDKELLKHFREEVEPVHQVWLILTNDENSLKALAKIREWENALTQKNFEIEPFVCPDTAQLADRSECRKMTDFIYRVVLLASEKSHHGKLFLSLAGGRKTMSADMQNAARLFGCDLLFHVADNLQPHNLLRKLALSPVKLTSHIPAEEINPVFPVVISKKKNPESIISMEPRIRSWEFPISQNDGKLIDLIDEREYLAGNLIINNYLERKQQSGTSYFHGLQLLDNDLVRKLQQTRIGVDPSRSLQEEQWIQKFPKAELHCHLGGILDAEGLILTAMANIENIKNECAANSAYQDWLDEISHNISLADVEYFSGLRSQGWKNLYKKCPQAESQLVISGFLSRFQGNANFLHRVIFGDFIQEDNYVGIGINPYMNLGDLQGSALLKNESCLRKALELLRSGCLEQNIAYCEIRCSPVNYATAKMNDRKVLDIILEELKKSESTFFKVIIIASRHGDSEKIRQHVRLVHERIDDPEFMQVFAGFDLAGDEEKVKPGMLRDEFEPLLEKCVNITIHAGETASVDNIWQAAYLLNADRIGHGLRLADHPELLERFVNRRISVELCPSSNFQIVGYRDSAIPETSHLPVYPLKNYFDEGLQVTINTDNPGISATNLSREYLKAARMTPGGLSQWEILQLIRNSFKAAFGSKKERKQLLLNAENKILQLLRTENEPDPYP